MSNTNSFIRTEWLYVLIILAVLLNFSGLFITIMAPDGALYASIAKTMVLRQNYTDLFAEGRNWLDKPHFPFWMMALSFNCFGFTTWAYKLPALIFLMMGACYTYLFAKSLYNKQIALWAVLILLTAEHIVISDNDVRAEPYLTGLIIASVYHFYKACTARQTGQLVVACLFAACAVMTKGIFALIPICGAIAGQFIIKKQWAALFNIRWLTAAVLILLFITPELYALYHQFDMHPEIVVFGHAGVSGIRFFFWDSQFGRFFNTGPIKGSGDPFFFVHTTLWAFLPWSLLLFAAIFQFFKKHSKTPQNAEWFCICGSLLTFLVFSASKFQLPFYTNIIYPFFAIIAAQYLCTMGNAKSIRAAGIVQTVVIVLMVAIVALLHFFYRPDNVTPLKVIILAIVFVGLVFLPGRLSLLPYQKTGLITVLGAVLVNLYFNLIFYPSLLQYQSGSEAAVYINQLDTQKLQVVQYIGDYGYPLEFYLNQPLITLDAGTVDKHPSFPFLLYANEVDIKGLNDKGWHTREIKTFERFWITKLTPAFINKNSRAAVLDHYGVFIVR